MLKRKLKKVLAGMMCGVMLFGASGSVLTAEASHRELMIYADSGYTYGHYEYFGGPYIRVEGELHEKIIKNGTCRDTYYHVRTGNVQGQAYYCQRKKYSGFTSVTYKAFEDNKFMRIASKLV